MYTFHTLTAWIEEMRLLCTPDKVVWCTGSEEEYQAFLQQMVSEGKAKPLNPIKRPGSYAFFSDPSDVARTENRTFIACQNPDDAGPTNNWVDPDEIKKTLKASFRGSLKGRTMYVIPFMMGPLGAPVSKIGIQLTDSLYVVVNMRLMTRMGSHVLKALEKGGEFVPCLHSVGYPLEKGQKDLPWPCAPIEKKYIVHFPEERMIWSYGSGYGGNALLGKKCLALRIASVLARDEGWMAEHMLILKLTDPNGKYRYILGAFPSACGKTNLAMLVPTLPGWTVETLGDDIAWIRLGKDGRLYAINPEYGFFGVAKGTSFQSNPNAMHAISKNTLFTNVALTDDLDVWWEGIDGPIPAHLTDWQGQSWTPQSSTPAAHPNSRFTVSTKQCPVLAKEWENPEGVPISAILVGGRRPTTIPLVHESFSWAHGVFMGSTVGSEITAASISNNIGQVRRDPFAMLPFIGYHVGDYLKHWLDMGKKTSPEKLPRIFYVNWFRKDDQGHFFWPGFGENSRVLKWIFERCEGNVQAKKTPIGYMPYLKDLDTDGLVLEKGALKTLTDVHSDVWTQEAKDIRQYYEKLGPKIPHELYEELDGLSSRLK